MLNLDKTPSENKNNIAQLTGTSELSCSNKL